ncbi:15306_t:CDS:1 [Dentiscutata heterogama]|uniref:15306_t:CDS:1 n=1 Tax=Dentiscutata heterogama TaxID=1316150 RepID=A0ACA9N680_9GLOM|nr:15306_t:CDS:1 [Dentiscutata heterogama]
MKFLSILTVFLVFVIAIAHTAVIKRKVGDQVRTDGVRFKDLYQSLTHKFDKTYGHFSKLSDEFDTTIKAAAKEDGTDDKTKKVLLKWNEKYLKEVSKMQASNKKLQKSIKNLNNLLHK